MTKLTPEEINTISQKDTLFKDFYKMMEMIRDSVLVSDVDKSEYINLKYKDYLDLNEFYLDSTYWNGMDDSLEERWNEKYKGTKDQIDSIIQFYNKRYENNKLDNYLKIELDRVNTNYYSYSIGVKDVQLGFKLTPLKGEIQQLVFYYSLTPKINENKDDSLLGNLLKDLNGCRSMTPFSRPITRYWTVGYSLEKELSGSTKDEVLRDYNLEIHIDRIRTNDMNLDSDDSKLPYEVEQYNKYEDSPFMRELYEEDISEEFLNKKYLSVSNFKQEVRDSIVNSNEKFKKINDLYKKYYERNR
jgi:hypothetical protein